MSNIDDFNLLERQSQPMLCRDSSPDYRTRSIGRGEIEPSSFLQHCGASVRGASAVGNEGLTDRSNYGERWPTDAPPSAGVESLSRGGEGRGRRWPTC